MALSANQNIQRKANPVIMRKDVVDGAIIIYKGAILNHEASNAGNLKLGSDTLSEKFAGIALEALSVAAGDNPADGTFKIEILPAGCGEHVLMNIRSTITKANEKDKVYVDGDDYFDIASGITNTTNGFAGIISEYVSANKAWVQLADNLA